MDSQGYLYLRGKLRLGVLLLGSVLTERSQRTALDDLLLKVVIEMGIKTALYCIVQAMRSLLEFCSSLSK